MSSATSLSDTRVAVRQIDSRVKKAYSQLLLRKKNVAALRRQLTNVEFAAQSAAATASASAAVGRLGDDDDDDIAATTELHLADFNGLSVEDGLDLVIRRLQRVKEMRDGRHNGDSRGPSTSGAVSVVGAGLQEDVDVWRVIVNHGAEQVRGNVC